MSRRSTLAWLAAAALLTAACGEDASQRSAREVLQARLRALPQAGGYDMAQVHCSRAGRLYFTPVRTTRSLCTARRTASGDCDWFRVDLPRDGRVLVLLLRRSAGCAIPGA